MSSHFILYGLIGLMVILWSGNYIAAKIAFREFPALMVMSIRMIMAALMIAPIFWRQLRRRATPLSFYDLRLLALLGIVGITLNQFFWVMGTARTTVIHSSMIMATIPVWVLVMAALMRLERVTWPKLLGMVLAMIGIAILQMFKPLRPGSVATLTGDSLVMLCALNFAALTAFGKRYRPQGGGIAINAFAYIGGAVLLAPALWWSGRHFNFGAVSWTGWAAVFYMAACSSVVCYLIYYYALEHISASRMAAVQYLQPVLASVMAMIILHEALTAGTMAAGGIIMAGVYVTERFG